MLKYVDTKVVFREVPDEVTLAINISNCPNSCPGCHSSYLSEDIGEVLTITRIKKLLKENEGVTAICFMGGDNDPKLINHYAKLLKETKHYLKVAWYSGKSELSNEIDLFNFDFIKLGPYIEEYGPLDSRTTNQRFYKVVQTSTGKSKLIDLTDKFWRHETKN